MALNMSNKKWICNQILPEATFSITGNGITVSSERFTTPRFIPFEINGKCKECKSTELELDFVITKEGVTLFCSRNKQSRFLPFDAVYELPGYCFFRVKNKGRVFNVPHGSPAEPIALQQMEPPKSSEAVKAPSPKEINAPPMEPVTNVIVETPMEQPAKEMESPIMSPEEQAKFEEEDIKKTLVSYFQ
jgi:hypothetical protein